MPSSTALIANDSKVSILKKTKKQQKMEYLKKKLQSIQKNNATLNNGTSSSSSSEGTKKGKTSSKATNINLRKRKRNTSSYKSYIFKILKKYNNENGRITKKAINIIDQFTHHIIKKLCIRSADLVKFNRRTTMKIRDVQSAVRMILPGELANHAVFHGIKAMKFYKESKDTVNEVEQE